MPVGAWAQAQGAPALSDLLPARTKVRSGPPPPARDEPVQTPEPGEPIWLAVAPGDWGSAAPREIRMVLLSAARVLATAVARPGRDVLALRVMPRSGSPRVLYERSPEGYYVVQLTARDIRWNQFAYQFAHELCHIYSNFDHKEMHGATADPSNQWFEEALCEAASLHSLKAMTQAWASEAPSRNLLGYAPAFEAYAKRLLAEEHRQLPAGRSFGDWFAEHYAELRGNPYLRDKNELIATQLLPLFERQPDLWQAIVYLNPHTASASKPFADYLGDWHAACPDRLKPAVAEVLALFGVLPQAPVAAHPD
ncbi:MAG: hypothetical protein JNJ60_08880 [Rhodocyclaceae bacterium]|nr:hypothetical protein [Rhodocyclaceae bacterium]